MTTVAFHLLALQLFCWFGWTVFQTLRQTSSTIPDASNTATTPALVPRSIEAWLATIVPILALVVALPLYSQAILHLTNTSTLAILSLLVYLPGMLLPSTHDPQVSTNSHYFRTTIFVLAIATILAFDYRVSVSGLIFGVLGVGLFAVLRTLDARLDRSAETRPTRFTQLVAVTLALLIAIGLALACENTPPAFFRLAQDSWVKHVTMVVNPLFTAIALQLGGSTTALMPNDRRTEKTDEMISATRTVAALVCFFMAIRQSTIVSPVQLLAYFAAVMCLGSNVELLFSLAFRPILNYLGYLPVHGDEKSADRDDVSYHLVDMDDQSTRPSDPKHSPSKHRSRESWPNPLIAICWLVIICRSTYDLFPTSTSTTQAYLDTQYHATSGFDIVISMYNEPVSELIKTITLATSIPAIADRHPRLYIYIKDAHADTQPIHSSLTDLDLDPQITTLPNIGREGHTYLHHILTHWDDLANHTLFLQAETHNPRETGPRIRDYYAADTGMLPLSFVGNTCPCGPARQNASTALSAADPTDPANGPTPPLCADRTWSDTSGLIQRVYLRAARLSTCPSPSTQIALSYKGQFIASAARIRGVERALYAELQDLFENETSWVHAAPYVGKGWREDVGQEMSAPVFGFVMERMWGALLQCGDAEVVRRCPSLLAGWRLGGRRGDCQCLDREFVEA